MLDRFLERTCAIFGVASTVAVMVIMLVTVCDALGRAIFNSPVGGASEFAVMALVAVVFLGLASGQRRGSNFKVELLVRFLPPWVQRVLEVLWRLVVLAFLVYVAWLSSLEAHLSTIKLEASYGVVKFPIWPSRIVLAAGLWVLSAQIFLEITLLLRGRRLYQDADNTTSFE